MIKLEAITWDNFWAVTNLKLTKKQAQYTLNNAMFIAQGYLNLKAGYPDALKAITYNNKPIGFVKWVRVPQDVGPYHLKQSATLIDAFMLDCDAQHQGFGKEALNHVIKAIRADARFPELRLVLLCHEANQEAHAFFKRADFVKTGASHMRENDRYLWFERVN